MPSQGDRHDTMIFNNCRLSALLRFPRDPGSNLGGPPDWAMHPHHRLPYGCHTRVWGMSVKRIRHYTLCPCSGWLWRWHRPPWREVADWPDLMDCSSLRCAVFPECDSDVTGEGEGQLWDTGVRLVFPVIVTAIAHCGLILLCWVQHVAHSAAPRGI